VEILGLVLHRYHQHGASGSGSKRWCRQSGQLTLVTV
jgi:hypothetical protein